MISRKASRKSNDNFLENKWKSNVTLTVFHEANNQMVEGFRDEKNGILFETELQQLHKHSADG